MSMTGLTTERLTYKPFNYPWAYEAWLLQQKLHWIPEEVPLADDVQDWRRKLTESERNLVTQIFRFFTQADVEVNNCYHKHYMSVFKPTEIIMMLTAFSNMETVHMAAYSHLLDTLGMPESEYEAFMIIKEMADKHDYMQQFSTTSPMDVALTLAGFGAFTEGLQLFASFAILMNFQRFNKMKGMGQIVAWSVRDETLHCQSIIRLYHTWLSEHPDLTQDDLEPHVTEMCRRIVSLEDAFVDRAFEMGDVEGLSAAQVKLYVRYIADRRMIQLGFDPIFNVGQRNPLPWMDEMMSGVEFTNFFENRVTEYSKASTKGNWGLVKF